MSATRAGISVRARVVAWAALAAALCAACGNSEGSASEDADDKAAATIAKIDPCTLVAKNEIQAAIEAKRDPDQLASLKSQGVVWSITTTPGAMGEARICRIHWQGTVNGEMREKGDMSLSLYKAEYFESQVADMNRVRRRHGRPELSPIPGVGDEAHFFGYDETGDPEAKVGVVAVGVDALAGKPSVDLLRTAVSRVTAR